MIPGGDGAPTVSVVLPVRNGERFIRQAVESVLSQTFSDFELIVVENGSVDGTSDILNELAAADHRVRVVESGEIGLVAALNLGLRHAAGEFLARMDADDVSLPMRFARQVDALRADPTLVAVGTRYRYVDEDGRVISARKVPLGSAALGAAFHFGNPLAHPSVMLAPRRLDQPLVYSSEYPDAEDFELWLRLWQSGTIRNIADELLEHRVHADSVTANPERGRRSSINALGRAVHWPPGVAKWVHERTFNPGQGDVGLVAFALGVLVLNVCSLVRPLSTRRAVAARSATAVGSFLRARLGRGRSRP